MNTLPTLSKKTLSKLIQPDFRSRILKTYIPTSLGLEQYAKYVVDSQIVSRDKSLENDKKSYFGFQPINVLCYVSNSGSVVKKFIEFNSVNHFLKDYKGEIAIDVVKCMLILLYLENKKDVKNFDYELIDAELQRLENMYVEQQKNNLSAETENDN